MPYIILYGIFYSISSALRIRGIGVFGNQSMAIYTEKRSTPSFPWRKTSFRCSFQRLGAGFEIFLSRRWLWRVFSWCGQSMPGGWSWLTPSSIEAPSVLAGTAWGWADDLRFADSALAESMVLPVMAINNWRRPVKFMAILDCPVDLMSGFSYLCEPGV